MIAQTYSEQFEIMQTAMRKTATQVDIFRATALKKSSRQNAMLHPMPDVLSIL